MEGHERKKLEGQRCVIGGSWGIEKFRDLVKQKVISSKFVASLEKGKVIRLWLQFLELQN